jgi:hypothetical protein
MMFAVSPCLYDFLLRGASLLWLLGFEDDDEWLR